MAGTFILTEDAARYGVTDPSVIDYFPTEIYGDILWAIENAAHGWIMGQPTGFTYTLPDGYHLVLSGTPRQYGSWQPGFSFHIRFTPDPVNGAAFSTEGNTLDLTIAKMNLFGNSADNIFAPTVDTIYPEFDGGAGFDVIDLRGHTGNYGLHMSPSIPFTGVRADGVYDLSFTWLDSIGETYRSPDYGISNVERVIADTWAIAYDLGGNAGQAYRLYQAAFDRQPDLPGLGYQINALDQGLPLPYVAQNFLNSPEFQTLYGTHLSDEDYITALYANVLHRAPDPGGFAYQVDALKHFDRAQLLVNFSESPENQANVIGNIYAGILYVPDH
jgi:hypothetical protein